MSGIKIIVATHKEYWMPEDSMYLPIQVGAEGKDYDLGYIKDNTGKNISSKNANYCELTGLYWAWKNLKADYVGLAHYRRHFCIKGVKGTKKEKILTTSQVSDLLKKTDIILPNPRNYYIETNYSQYAHAHHAIDLDTTRKIIAKKYPVKRVFTLHHTHMTGLAKLLCGGPQRIDDINVCYSRKLNRRIFLTGSFHADGTACHNHIRALDVQLHAAAGTYTDKRVRAALHQFLHGNGGRRTANAGGGHADFYAV